VVVVFVVVVVREETGGVESVPTAVSLVTTACTKSPLRAWYSTFLPDLNLIGVAMIRLYVKVRIKLMMRDTG